MFSSRHEKKLLDALGIAFSKADVWRTHDHTTFLYNYDIEIRTILDLIKKENEPLDHQQIDNLFRRILMSNLHNSLVIEFGPKAKEFKDLVKTSHWLVVNVNKWNL